MEARVGTLFWFSQRAKAGEGSACEQCEEEGCCCPPGMEYASAGEGRRTTRRMPSNMHDVLVKTLQRAHEAGASFVLRGLPEKDRWVAAVFSKDAAQVNDFLGKKFRGWHHMKPFVKTIRGKRFHVGIIYKGPKESAVGMLPASVRPSSLSASKVKAKLLGGSF